MGSAGPPGALGWPAMRIVSRPVAFAATRRARIDIKVPVAACAHVTDPPGVKTDRVNPSASGETLCGDAVAHARAEPVAPPVSE